MAMNFPKMAAFLSIVSISACGDDGTIEYMGRLNGPDPDIDSEKVSDFKSKLTEKGGNVIENLKIISGLSNIPEPGDKNWKYIIDAGVLYVNSECGKYMEAIFWFDRGRDATKSNLSAIGGAAAPAMQILKASAESISLTAAAFGLTGTLLDTSSNSILYSIEPSAIKTLLDDAQAAYYSKISDEFKENGTSTRYRSQASALLVVQGYLSLCLPYTLETLINQSVKKTSITATADGPAIRVTAQ
jgi:hypothetical protein